jgi:small ligand-binding sensory domain FIST
MGTRFIAAHATHPDWRMALALAAAQADAQRAGPPAMAPTLGWLYLTDHYADAAEGLLAEARARWPGTAFVGTVGIGVAAGGVEYIDEPALALMLCDLPREQFQVFHGREPPAGDLWTAQVHADPTTTELPELIGELADRMGSHYLFGGLASSRGRCVLLADGVWQGGLAGLGLRQGVRLISRVTQGCQPLGPTRRVGAAKRNVVMTLDGEAALPLLLGDLGISLEQPTLAARHLRATLVGLTDARDTALARGGQFGADTRVRHLIGVDPAHRSFAVADLVAPGMQLAFCTRNADAARRDLVRICTEIRAEAEGDPDDPGTAPGRIAGALYFSCTGRGGPHFGGPSAELQIVRHALGDVPLAGFFAAGEIAHRHLYGYTGVLTAFVSD